MFLRKILYGLTLMVLTVVPSFIVGAFEGVPASTQKYHHQQIGSSQTRILRRNIRVILKDHRFDYPDHLKRLKEIWRHVLNWLAKRRAAKKTIAGPFWDQALRYLGYAALLALPFLLIYFLPKIEILIS